MAQRAKTRNQRAAGLAGTSSPRARDFALRRLTACSRWLIAGSLALTGVFSELAASAFPGKAVKAGSAHRATPAAAKARVQHESHVHREPPSSSLQAPAQAPTASPETHASEATPERHETGPENHETAPEAHTEAAPERHEATPETHSAAPSEQHVESQAATPSAESTPAQSAPAQTSETPVVSGGS
jgi:hypothetical protein